MKKPNKNLLKTELLAVATELEIENKKIKQELKAIAGLLFIFICWTLL